MFGRVEPPDGVAPELEAVAGEIGSTILDDAEGGASAATSRRDREADAGSDVLMDALGSKLLHGWLQNRHQTLLPLNLNLSLMTRDQQEGLAGILASLLLAGRPAADAAEFATVMRSWLAGLGADADILSRFDDTLQSPYPLNVVFDIAQTSDLTIYAYVAALMVSDTRYPVSTMLCDIVQARFDLPSAMVRSAVRRYRR